MHSKSWRLNLHAIQWRLTNQLQANDTIVSLVNISVIQNYLNTKIIFEDPSSILDVNDAPWSNDEQQLLEQAMKTYPLSLGVQRWDMIADCIPNRSRADCIKRYKFIVDKLRSKNAAKNEIKAKK